MAQLISVVPPRSPELQGQAKRDNRRDSRRSSEQCSRRSNEQYQVDSRRPRRLDKKYTELTESISKILPKIQHLSFFKRPSKMIGPPDTRRRDRRSEYHKEHGHETDSCYVLKDHLEELLQDDRLAQHIRKSNQPNKKSTAGFTSAWRDSHHI